MRRFARFPALAAWLSPALTLALILALSPVLFPVLFPVLPLAAQEQTQGTLAQLTKAAEAGNLAAQLRLAEAYEAGQDLPQNYARAADWYRAAAEQGHAGAQNRLGKIYAAGRGLAQNPARARHWLQAAAQQGDPQHVHDLAVFLETSGDGTDLQAAARLYEQAAASGLLEAQVSLAVLLQDGRGLAQDFDRARQLYEVAAAQGHARAQNNLGLLYSRGSGVPQNYQKAASLFQAAADQGLAAALRNLGVMYENGFGVPLDEARAAELYRQGGHAGSQPPVSLEAATFFYDPRLAPLAANSSADNLRPLAEAGDPLAQFQLGWLLSQQARPVPDADPDPALDREAAHWFAQAAAKGHVPAMANLGLAHVQGRGVIQDYLQGRVWLTLAQASGLLDTAPLLQALDRKMPPAQIAEAQAEVEALWTKLRPAAR